ncbi:hypothetical protein GGX14DRAFT_383764 [Mycena pura]|uniref:Uncharacterized protein n=1 Tax=Mycena pura TaxID=153505 RepID=A0AAD7E5B4_9AGAR|nr:hypothetical protein GGX14DRAFT_383764 [Mycena pura]
MSPAAGGSGTAATMLSTARAVCAEPDSGHAQCRWSGTAATTARAEPARDAAGARRARCCGAPTSARTIVGVATSTVAAASETGQKPDARDRRLPLRIAGRVSREEQPADVGGVQARERHWRRATWTVATERARKGRGRELEGQTKGVGWQSAGAGMRDLALARVVADSGKRESDGGKRSGRWQAPVVGSTMRAWRTASSGSCTSRAGGERRPAALAGGARGGVWPAGIAGGGVCGTPDSGRKSRAPGSRAVLPPSKHGKGGEGRQRVRLRVWVCSAAGLVTELTDMPVWVCGTLRKLGDAPLATSPLGLPVLYSSDL